MTLFTAVVDWIINIIAQLFVWALYGSLAVMLVAILYLVLASFGPWSIPVHVVP